MTFLALFYLSALSHVGAGDLALTDQADASDAVYSKLWGKNGEKWSPASRLPDFSFAGYHSGEIPIPTITKNVVSVADFGANVGTDISLASANDAAFQAAITKVQNLGGGVVYFPAGTYVLTEQVKIASSNLIIRGAGRDRTTLYYPKPLAEAVGRVAGAVSSGVDVLIYHYCCGFISFEGDDNEELVGALSSDAKRGSQVLTLTSASGLSAGQFVSLRQHDKSQSLVRHILADDPMPANKKIADIRFISKIVSVEGNKITLERPLRLDARRAWNAAIYKWSPSVQEVGIEDLTIKFQKARWGGQFSEEGFNAVNFTKTANSWARNLRIHNADSGIYVSGRFMTIQNIEFTADPGVGYEGLEAKYTGITGNDGINPKGALDVLMDGINFETDFNDEFTFDTYANGNVIMNSTGVNLEFDHHGNINFENLVTNVYVGRGDNIYDSGGSKKAMPHAGARFTLWNVSNAACNLKEPGFGLYGLPWGPKQQNIVALCSSRPESLSPTGLWFEPIDPAKIQPQNLYLAQLNHRLGKLPAPTP
ncbi:MAG: glycosyl hydrolase family 28-related protein [Dongiaceae bacterium]